MSINTLLYVVKRVINIDNDRKIVEKWLEKIMCVDFAGKEIIQEQINQANISIVKHYAYISVEFDFNETVPQLPWNMGVPVSMLAHQENSAPVHFAIHTKNNHITELEVVMVDLSKIDINNIDISNVEYFA